MAVRSVGPLLRLGVVGVGDVAQRDYLPEMRRLAGLAEVVAVAGATEARARATAERFGIPAWTTGYEALLRRDDVDAVLNLTPIGLHEEVIGAALRAGKHVYTEKPLARTSAVAAALLADAERRGLILATAPCVALFPQLRSAKEVLASGAIGPVRSVRARVSAGPPPWPGYASDPSSYFEAGTGPLLDLGVYPLHAIAELVGLPRAVTAMSTRSRDKFRAPTGSGERLVVVSEDDNWHLILDLGQVLASVVVDFCAQSSAGRELEVLGERGSVAIDLLDVAAPIAVFEPDSGWREEVPVHAREAGPDHILGVQAFAAHVLGRAGPLLDPRVAVAVLAVLDAARRSAEEGRAVPVAGAGSDVGGAG
jgi:predicted dehydrogenase